MTASVYGFLTDFPVIIAFCRSAMDGLRHTVTGIIAVYGISVCRVTFITSRKSEIRRIQAAEIKRFPIIREVL
jgi:hypothetical protein